MQESTSQHIGLLELDKESRINHISEFCDATNEIDPIELTGAYHRLRELAPHRHARNKSYFMGHTGVPSSGKHSNRREEHLAIAIWNETQESGPLRMPNESDLDILDYQFPLNARQSDKGIGKVDLFGVAGKTKPCVIELKIHPANTGMGDTPLWAFLEALVYCAIVEANADDIAQEVFDNYGKRLIGGRPDLVVMAPEEYWRHYIIHQKTGNWWPALRRLADQLEESFGLVSHFIALRDADFSMGLEGQKPRLLGDCSLISLAELMS